MSEPKGPLDVYREAASEYGGPNEGCAAGCAVILIMIVWGICHLFGWLGL